MRVRRSSKADAADHADGPNAGEECGRDRDSEITGLQRIGRHRRVVVKRDERIGGRIADEIAARERQNLAD